VDGYRNPGSPKSLGLFIPPTDNPISVQKPVTSTLTPQGQDLQSQNEDQVMASVSTPTVQHNMNQQLGRPSDAHSEKHAPSDWVAKVDVSESDDDEPIPAINMESSSDEDE
jgi:hypothetical protein